MSNTFQDSFTDRLKTAADARQALLSRFKPAPSRPAPEPVDRAQERAVELGEVRLARAQAKASRRDAELALADAKAQAIAELDAAALAAKRGDRKERKALSAAEAKAKRDARYAARQARR